MSHVSPREGRGTKFTRDLRRDILETIQDGKKTKQTLYRHICLKWNIMGRSFNEHFSDVVELGLIEEKGPKLVLTEEGKAWLYTMNEEATKDSDDTPDFQALKDARKGGES
ncbi:MAG: hypothetical protein KGI38_12650 [Thaumarchaeota archaeon]|nr:hypothetical protein [Nitrososphaerota archaeon]